MKFGRRAGRRASKISHEKNQNVSFLYIPGLKISPSWCLIFHLEQPKIVQKESSPPDPWVHAKICPWKNFYIRKTLKKHRR